MADFADDSQREIERQDDRIRQAAQKQEHENELDKKNPWNCKEVRARRH